MKIGTEEQAMRWYEAEVRELRKTLDTRVPRELQDKIPHWFRLTEARRDEIRKRVALVLTGEVRRSEMTAGDLVVYFGWFRMLDTSPSEKFLAHLAEVDQFNARQRGEDGNARLRFEREIRRTSVWDCLEFQPSPRPQIRTRLFGNANVGCYHLTNLQVAGQLVCDQSAQIIGWHISTNADADEMPLVHELLSESVITLTLGDRPQDGRAGDLLWREPWPMDVIVLTRQNLSVTVEFFHKHQRFMQLTEQIIAGRTDAERDPFRVWVHLEMFHARSVW